jgi:hypothetical protein
MPAPFLQPAGTRDRARHHQAVALVSIVPPPAFNVIDRVVPKLPVQRAAVEGKRAAARLLSAETATVPLLMFVAPR